MSMQTWMIRTVPKTAESPRITREKAMMNVLQVMRLTQNQLDYLKKNGVIIPAGKGCK